MESVMARDQDYPIIRFLAGAFYVLATAALLAGVGTGTFLWLRAEAIKDGIAPPGPLAETLRGYTSSEICLAAVIAVAGGVLCFLLLGSVGQLLAMQRDRAIHSAQQVQLLEDILELNEQSSGSLRNLRVELCDRCGRLASLHKTDDDQWVCRDCRREMRTAS
jgi:hypothetical protein